MGYQSSEPASIPWPGRAGFGQIGLPKTRRGRYTPSSFVEDNRGPRRRRGNGRRLSVAVSGPHRQRQRGERGRQPPVGATTAEFCCVLGFAGMPALPALLGRGKHLAGPSGFWVGHSSERFTVELMSDREPGLRARLPGIHAAGAQSGADVRVLSWRRRANALLCRTGRRPGTFAAKFNPAIPSIRESLSCRGVRRCP